MLLHIAALPFPTHQGTQVALRHMLECEADAGWDSCLLTYAAAGYDFAPRFALYRCGRFRSLRSGPSLGKVLTDVRLAAALRRLAQRLRPRAIVAHHVEAACAALCTGQAPVVFFAHTDLSEELPCYGPAVAAAWFKRAGRALDCALVARCAATAAISPLLAARLGRGTARYVPLPMPNVSAPGDRLAARRSLRLPPQPPILLYAGNLDAYQGVDCLPPLLAEVRKRHPEARLLLATRSNATALMHNMAAAGLAECIDRRDLDGEARRAALHAAADLAVIPRRALGGVPVKLLDSLARGLPVVAGPAACAGLPLKEVCGMAPADTPAALAATAVALLDNTSRLADLSLAARCYVAHMHSPHAYLTALDTLLCQLAR